MRRLCLAIETSESTNLKQGKRLRITAQPQTLSRERLLH